MNKSFKNSSLYLLQVGISGALMLGLMSIVSLHLTPGELGQFVLAQVYMATLVSIANLGVLTGYDRNFFLFEKSLKRSSLLLYSALTFVLMNLTLLLIVVYYFQTEIGHFIFTEEPPNNLLIVVLLGASAYSLSQYYLTFLKNSGLAWSYIANTITNSVVNFFIAVLLLIQFNLGPMSLAYAWLISNVILLTFLFLAFLNKKLPVGLSFNMLKEMLRISLPLTPKVFFGYINTQLDKVLLGLIGSSSLVGIYHMGQTVALAVFQFMTGLGRVFQPELYRKLFANRHVDSKIEIHSYLLPFLYISIGVALLIVIFAKELVLIFLSPEFQEATIIIVILSMYYAFLFFGKITGAQLIYAKKTHITTLLILLGMVINVALNVPFIILWGIVGAAWATAIAGLITTLVGYFIAQKYAEIQWFWRSIFTIYGLFVLVALFSILDYGATVNYTLSLLLKSTLLLAYVLVGYRLNLVSIDKLKKLLFAKK